MGEADIGDAGGKKARAAAACFDPCLRLLRAEAAQSLVGQRVEQGFLVGEIAIEGSRADPDLARECPEANRDAVPIRSEERRVGKECVSTCRSRWSPSH